MMYELVVHHGGVLTRKVKAVGAAELLALIPQLLRDHPGCERLDVMSGEARLFSVDCRGQPIADASAVPPK